jgi:putative tricarboxylic transport membrane protein
LMLGAMLIQGIQPGPEVMTGHPDLFWGLIGSMWLGNLMLLVINLPLVGIWIKLLQTPYRLLYPMILVFSCVGVYSIRNEPFDIILAAIAGVGGYILRKLDCPAAPLILGLILGPVLEENLRRSLLISRGDPTIFVTRPISLAIILFTVALVIVLTLPALRRRTANPSAPSAGT